MPSPAPNSSASYGERVDFVIELARRLHAYGTTAQRIEGAITAVAHKLRLECEPWSNPTGMILTFSDPARRPGEADITRVIRLPLGENDLHRLSETDRIAEDVLVGRLDLAQALAAMRALDTLPTRRARALQVFGFGLAATAIAGLLRLPWLDIVVAGCNGLMIGLLVLLAELRPRLREGFEAVAALLASMVAVLVASFIAPLNQNTVIIASLIVLLPGMALTNAVNELTSGHLVSGTARFSGAVTTVMKLAVGAIIALYLCELLGLQPQVRAMRPQPGWMEWLSLAMASFAFAVLFRADIRDYPKVMAAAATGYLVARFGGMAFGSPAGIFLAALLMTVAGNAFARWWHRPGALIRVPGIIMLVPGSVSLRGLLDLLQQQDIVVGQGAVLAVLNILLALIAGLLFGNLLLAARRNL
ncbi:threonine/serine exporter family protein [Lysobacter psychrotolerans]|uniref:Threonine/serine exporter family protein n=2 Tax=Montanilutibacter psychrotolerans TaxID=1327343 RepID=A0A3M8T0A0_9GAMM|nr:threonine/serine exporter family protein [Lysobacter psychrotolerans]RNF84560.1 threonine/serine exporter family protein [Lysobacter psychrotolerans]